MAGTMVQVCKTADVAAGKVKRFDVNKIPIAIYNIDGTFYATEDTCTHGMASLAEGALDGDVNECWMHFGAFHVPSGKPVSPPCTVPIKTFPVTVVEGAVLIEM